MARKINNEEFLEDFNKVSNGEYTLLSEYKGKSKKIKIRHNCDKCNNYEYEIVASEFLKGVKCQKCAGRVKRTTEDFKKEVYYLVGDEYTVLGKYINTKTPIKMRHNCPDCNNHEYEVKPKNFLNLGNRCPKCKGTHKKSLEEFKKEVHDLVGNEYTVLGEYINTNTPIKMRHNCPDCNNHEYEVRPVDFISKSNRCPICNGNIRKSLEEFKKEVYDIVGDEYTVLGSYINTNTPIKMRHNCIDCNNHEYEVSRSNFIKGSRCPICYPSTRLKTHEEFVKLIYDIVGDEYTVLSQYKNDKEKVLIRHNCDTCNNFEYKVTPNKFISLSRRCPKCNILSQTSKGEDKIYNYIIDLDPNITIIRNDRTLLDGQELDLYLPDYNVAIEFDGLYWHSEDSGKDKKYHLDKTNKCLSKGIQLIHIFEDELELKEDIVKSKLKSILQKSNNERIYARKCIVKKIDSPAVKNKFLNLNHIQGSDSSSIQLGLYTKDTNKLVSVMTFCKPRVALGLKNTKYDYELSRFASDINYIVIGGFSKLLSYFKKNYEWNELVTYADRRWSKGMVYIKNGWTLDHISEPNYWYCKGLDRYHRYNFRKQVLKEKFPNIYKEELTEFEIMDKSNYSRIWDCGNIVFTIKNEEDK